MTQLASFWIGDALGEIENISIRSFLKHGNHMVLYAYAPVANVPAGVEMRDAHEIFPTKKIIRHKKSGSPALHSDLFRYALMQKSDYIWVDLDIVCLRPLNFETEWVFGFERPDCVNGAVLRLPKDSPALHALCQYSIDTKGLPPMLTGFRRFKYHVKSLGMGMSIDSWPWGSLGPWALTYHLGQTGEIQHAYPIEAFYSIPLEDAARFAQPNGIQRSDIPENAWLVHLWGKKLREYIDSECDGVLPQDSFLARCLND